MAYGVAPGQDVKDDWDEVEDGGTFHVASSRDLLGYFFNHPKIKFGRKRASRNEQLALARSMKKLRQTYTDAAIRRAIDRFYLTRTSQNHSQPAFAFCNLEFQDKLFAGAEQVEIQDDVLTFIANGFQREEGIDLPWGPEFDSDLRVMFIIDEGYNYLVRTYPEVVSEILAHWGPDPDGKGGEMLATALEQTKYLDGSLDKPANLKPMSDRFSVPKDFAKRTNRPRRAHRTVTEAVRSARGR